MNTVVRRVRADEGPRVRDLRIEAVSDPDAAIAFLSSPEEERSRDEAFWAERATGSAEGNDAAQFVAVQDDDWVGTLTVLRRPAGAVNHHGHEVLEDSGDIVGVWVRPEKRGSGVIDALFAAADEWARDVALPTLLLDVHADNQRAQAAYRRLGFTDDGRRFTGVIGPEIGMRRTLRTGEGSA